MEFTTTSIVLFLCSLLWMLWGVRKPSWDPFAPARVFGAIWLFAIAVTQLYWSELQMKWTLWSWFCILGSMTSFLVGTRLATGSAPAAATFPLRVVGELDAQRFVRWLTALFLVCLAGYLARVWAVGAIPVLAANTEQARWGFYNIVSGSWVDKLGANLAFQAAAVIIACAFFLFATSSRGQTPPRWIRILVTGLLIVSILLLFSTAFRGILLTTLVVCVVLHHYMRRKLTALRLFALAAIVVAVGLAVVTYRHLTSPGFSLSFTYTLAQMRLAPQYSLLAEPYANIGLTMDNMVQLLERPLSWTFGGLTFGPLWVLLGLKWFFLKDAVFPFMPAFGFNTATYLYVFYQDFGPLGIFVMPFLFGWIAGRIYHGMLLTGRLFYLAGYAFVAMLILFSIMDNLFVLIGFWLQLFSVCLVVGLSRCPAPQAALTHTPPGAVPGAAPAS